MERSIIQESVVALWKDWHGNDVNTIHNLMESVQVSYFCNKAGTLTKITVETFYSEEIVREEYYLPSENLIEYTCSVRGTEVGSKWEEIDTGVTSIDWNLIPW